MEKLSRVITIVSNLGAVVGLLAVAFQINQNTRIIGAQMENDYFLADMQLELAMMGDNPGISWEKAVYAPDTLTRQDAVVLDRFFNYGIVQVARLNRMRELGFVSEEMMDERLRYLGWHLGNKAGERWWESGTEVIRPEEFKTAIDKALESVDYQRNESQLRALQPRP